MPTFDTAAKTHLDDAQVVKPAFYAWLDIVGEPLRATTAGHDVILTGTGDPELDGEYLGVQPELVNIGDVHHEEGGSQTVIASLSGLLLPDAELLAIIGNKINWQGRVARLWVQIRNENNVAQGAIVPYYTGYMTAMELLIEPDAQIIQLEIENYLTLLSEPSNRTWLSQGYYDSGDTSPSASISSANNARAGQGAGAGYGVPATDYGNYPSWYNPGGASR